MKMYNKISDWIDGVLSADIPDEVVAFCFNLYETDDDSWGMGLVGTGRFDPDDQDWACDEITDFNSLLIGRQIANGMKLLIQ